MRPSKDLPDPTSCARRPRNISFGRWPAPVRKQGQQLYPGTSHASHVGRHTSPGQRETGPWRAERMAEGSATSKSSSTIGACRVRLVNARRDAQSGCTVTRPTSRRSARLLPNFLDRNNDQGRPRPKSKPPLTRNYPVNEPYEQAYLQTSRRTGQPAASHRAEQPTGQPYRARAASPERAESDASDAISQRTRWATGR